MVTVQRNEYNSSTVKSSSYNYEHQTLTVHFSHATYIYDAVSAEDYNKFATAKSQGIALNDFIKGKYSYEKVNEVKKAVNI